MRILIVDDDATTLLTLAKKVRERGHVCDTASTASEALDLIKAFAYEAVAVDLLLGSCDGLAIAEAALARGARVVIESARDDRTIAEAVARLKGGDRVTALQKPYELNSLLKSLGCEGAAAC